MTDAISLLFQLGLGPFCIPLRHKVPAIDDWPNLPPVDEERVKQWLEMLFNLGFRCGSKSGLIVLDDDQVRHNVPDASRYVPPPTGLVARTPSGGTHFYYRAPSVPLGNSASRIASYVDVRADGGQVVCPPSKNPTTGVPYVWVSTGEPGTLPDDVLAVLTGPARTTVEVDMRHPDPPPSGSGYAETALVREAARIRTAPESTRHDNVVKAAFKIGQYVGSGALDMERARAELVGAGEIRGGDLKDTMRAIDDGMAAGVREPKSVPPPRGRQTQTVTAPEPVAHTRESVLVPGSHNVEPKDGKDGYIEQGIDKFAADVLRHIDKETIYRRSTAVGELHDGQFAQIEHDRLRSIIDSSVRLYASKLVDDIPIGSFRPCSRDNAAVVLKYAATQGKIRELRHIYRYPVCIGPDFVTASPEWNKDHGVYLACDRVPDPLPLDEARAVLANLTCDFPWGSPADLANYIGLMVTLVLRPAIPEPVPFHLVGAPVAGSGKSKALEVVIGCGLLGRPLPATQLGAREEERQKQITAAMLSGDSVIHLDNLRDYIDSAALASLLTCSVYRGRELGHSRMLALPNDSTIVGSGNNVSATDEIARRIVPIMLQPSLESPENRQDYKHPQLRAYVEAEIDRTRAAVFGLIDHWRRSHRPVGSIVVGSFERWSAVVGGIMQYAGYREWCTNLSTWRGTADDSNAELRAFVALWADRHQDRWVSVGDLYLMAKDAELFERKLNQSTETARKTAFAQRVVSGIANRVVSGRRIEVRGTGKKRESRLVPV